MFQARQEDLSRFLGWGGTYSPGKLGLFFHPFSRQGGKGFFSQTDMLRGDFYEFVIGDKFDGLFQREKARGLE